MKRIFFPLAFIVGLAVALSGAHGAAHPLATTHLTGIQSNTTHLT